MKYFANIFWYKQISYLAILLKTVAVMPLLFAIAIFLFYYLSFGLVAANSYADIGLRTNHLIVNTPPLETTHWDVSNSIFSSHKTSYTHYDVSNYTNNSIGKVVANTYKTELGTELKNNNNWIMVYHDIYGTRYSNQLQRPTTGQEIWWNTLGKQYNTNSIPLPNGSGMVWSYGVNIYHAIDNNDNTLYITATNRGMNYFTDGIAGHKIAAPHTIKQGHLNGTINAMDLRNGKIKWQNHTEFPPMVSPLITDNIVFVGYIPFNENIQAKTNHRKITATGVILALDKNKGEKLMEYDVGAAIPQGGPSLGNGLLFVPTDKIQIQSKNTSLGGGSIVAFGLPQIDK